MNSVKLFKQLLSLLGYDKSENYPPEDYKSLYDNADSVLRLLKSNKNLFDTFIKLGVLNAGVFERSKEFNASEIIEFINLLKESDNNFSSTTVDKDTLTFEVWKSYISIGVQSKPAKVVENMMKVYSAISDIMDKYFNVELHFDSTIECFYYLQEAISFTAYCLASPEIRADKTVAFCGKILSNEELLFSSHNLDIIKFRLDEYDSQKSQNMKWGANFLGSFNNLI